MVSNNIQNTIYDEFADEIEDGKRNVYFSQFYSSRDVDVGSIEDIFFKELEYERDDFDISKHDEHGFKLEYKDSPFYIWSLKKERWLFAYSTELDHNLRKKLDKLGDKIGWLLDVWIPGDIVDDLYHKFTPGEDNVNIEREWDPYWIYERGSEIPEELQSYYNNNYERFVEQEIEFSLKTAKSLVDKTLKEGVKEDLLEKSETSESTFTYKPNFEVAGDGGVNAKIGGPTSRVTVRQRGVVVHSTGEADATFDLIEEIDERTDYYEMFESAIPRRDFEKRDDGSLELHSYSPGRVLRFEFAEKFMDQEASIKLSNLLTVGQSDVDIHGIIEQRDELEFFARVYTSYDEGEYEIYCTSEEHSPILYVKPVSGETSSLVYLYQKLRRKFDPRIEIDFVETIPEMM